MPPPLSLSLSLSRSLSSDFSRPNFSNFSNLAEDLENEHESLKAQLTAAARQALVAAWSKQHSRLRKTAAAAAVAEDPVTQSGIAGSATSHSTALSAGALRQLALDLVADLTTEAAFLPDLCLLVPDASALCA
mmetsp:Transcript_28845/g.67584  ORF Transcript_28845/g.67584 Transcript_28845/m.67584 type:complete len:133 (-) Transcript_28845:26-424(-)